MMMNYDILEKKLIDIAKKISSQSNKQNTLSVSLVPIANRLGADIFLQFVNKPFRDAQISLNKPYKITLFRKSLDGIETSCKITSRDEKTITMRERFSVAHELGHLIAYNNLQIEPTLPSDKSEYWKQEKLAHSFARKLLLPEALITNWLNNNDVITINDCYKFASKLRVTLHVLSRSVCEHKKKFGFLKLVSGINEKSGKKILKVEDSICSGEFALPKHHAHILNEELVQILDSNQANYHQLNNWCFDKEYNQNNYKISWIKRIVGYASVNHRYLKIQEKYDTFWILFEHVET